MLHFNVETKSTFDDSITALREHLATNREGAVDITVSAYEGGDTLNFRMRRDKLYLDGFQKSGTGKWYHFKDATGWAGSTALPYGGAHRDLGTDLSTTQFNPAAKYKLDQLINHDGSMADTLKLGLGFYVIAISESARFGPVQDHLGTLISGIGKYNPHTDHRTYMSNWKTLTEAGSSDVKIPFK